MQFFHAAVVLCMCSAARVHGQTFHATPSGHAHNASMIVTLPSYGSFEGTQLLMGLRGSMALSKPVDAWLGVQYSTQPAGADRFKPASWPVAFAGVKDATQSGPACYQSVPSVLDQSEACLSIDVYRTSGIPRDQKLPLFVYIHGGSFVWGSSRSFDGPTFVAKSKRPLVVVTVQYRLGALGSLPSRLLQEENLLNLGLRDQRQMLLFLRKYAQHFGGNENEITLGGLSAGAHSVGFHLSNNYDEDSGRPLFSKAIMVSGSPAARAFPGADYPRYQKQYQEFMDRIRCPPWPRTAALPCLRSADVLDIQFVSSAMYSASEHNITWPWQPVSSGPLLNTTRPSAAMNSSSFAIPVLISSTSDDGSRFVPQDLQTNNDFVAFWRNLAPELTAEDLNDLQRLYPEPSTDLTNSSDPSFVSTQFHRISAAYGDYSYICPVQDTALRLSRAGATVYKARFDTPDRSPVYMGVPHASDEGYFNGRYGTQYPEVSESYSQLFASFVTSGNPNTYAAPDSPQWEDFQWQEQKQLAISPPSLGGTRMEVMTREQLQKCSWWMEPSRATRLNKHLIEVN